MSSEMNHNSHKKLTDALELLNEAAHEKKSEVEKLIANRFSGIQDAVQETAASGTRQFKKAKRLAQSALVKGETKVTKTIKDFNREVHRKPWSTIGGAALGALVVGLFLGRSGRKE